MAKTMLLPGGIWVMNTCGKASGKHSIKEPVCYTCTAGPDQALSQCTLVLMHALLPLQHILHCERACVPIRRPTYDTARTCRVGVVPLFMW